MAETRSVTELLGSHLQHLLQRQCMQMIIRVLHAFVEPISSIEPAQQLGIAEVKMLELRAAAMAAKDVVPCEDMSIRQISRLRATAEEEATAAEQEVALLQCELHLAQVADIQVQDCLDVWLVLQLCTKPVLSVKALVTADWPCVVQPIQKYRVEHSLLCVQHAGFLPAKRLRKLRKQVRQGLTGLQNRFTCYCCLFCHSRSCEC